MAHLIAKYPATRAARRCAWTLTGALLLTFLFAAPSLPGQTAGIPADWPPMPDRPTARYDSLFISNWGSAPPQRVFRRVYFVLMNRKASGDSIKTLFARLRAEPVGGLPSAVVYYVRIPDPGTRSADIDRMVALFQSSAAVRSVFPLPVDPWLIDELPAGKRPPNQSAPIPHWESGR
jgi:hypothetical protein